MCTYLGRQTAADPAVHGRGLPAEPGRRRLPSCRQGNHHKFAFSNHRFIPLSPPPHPIFSSLP